MLLLPPLLLFSFGFFVSGSSELFVPGLFICHDLFFAFGIGVEEKKMKFTRSELGPTALFRLSDRPHSLFPDEQGEKE